MDNEFPNDPLSEALKGAEDAQKRLTEAEEDLRAQHLQYIGDVLAMNYPRIETATVLPGCDNPECECGGNNVEAVSIKVRDSLFN